MDPEDDKEDPWSDLATGSISLCVFGGTLNPKLQ